jgi:hypothetical protein
MGNASSSVAYDAVESKNETLLREVLASNQASKALRQPGPNGQTALHIAANAKDLK